MRAILSTIALMPLLALPACLAAQEHEAHQASPYVDIQDREIKALSAEDVHGLLEAEGMGLALAAELNGYPGPTHVLEMADSLGLSPEQRAATEAVMQSMKTEAKALGARLVEAERALDRSFAAGTVEPAGMRETVVEIGRLEGELRGVHLAAHLETVRLLTPRQRHRYQELRGYGAGGHEH